MILLNCFDPLDGCAKMAKLDALMTSDSPLWYTPPHILDLARKVMGSIDLDPCSNEFGTTGATVCLTEQDDGLKWDWFKSAFLNPPYGREISAWIDKYNEQVPNMTNCIQLLPARTDTKWFQSMNYDVLCFLKGRLKFIDGNKLAEAVFVLGEELALAEWWKYTTTSAPFPSVLTFKGTMLAKAEFVKLCQPMGLVMHKVPCP